MSSNNWEDKILEVLKKRPHQTFRFTHILREVGAGKNQRRQVRRALQKLLDKEKIELFRNKHYGLSRVKQELEGILEVSGRSYRVKLLSRPSPEIPSVVPVRRSNIGTAMPGDRVKIRLVSRSRWGLEPHAVVTNVTERARKTLAGVFQFVRQNTGVVIPRDERLKRTVLIPHIPARCKVHNDDWVVVRIEDYTRAPEPLIARIKEVLGKKDQPGMDIYIIIRDYGVEPAFPTKVMKEVKEIPDKADLSDFNQREDLRGLPIFTIDPSTAKDFDDALSVEALPDGLIRLGVHIADVSHYVKPETALDREALDRGTSIYPVDRVVPMLPEKLSNNICSLRPDEERAAFSVMMDVDSAGDVVRSRLFPSVIRSNYRMTYEEVEAIYDGSDHWITSKYRDVLKELTRLFELTPILIQRRNNMGRLDLDIPEGEVVFNSAGEVIDLRRRTRLFSHQVVEEAMLLANETVARFITKKNLPCMYRIHEAPSGDKLDALLPSLESFGIKISTRHKHLTPHQLQDITVQAERMQQGWIVARLILRSMKRAVYSEENKGHFGIATDTYTHFTSPIRRYPDLMVHRILREAIKSSRPSRDLISRWEGELPEMAAVASSREQRAEEIERETLLVKSLEFMKHQMGEEFEGTISGVAPWGFYVELDLYPVEGMVPRRLLPGDQYNYDEHEHTLRTQKGKGRFRLGDRVVVMVERVDIDKRHLDFKFLARITH